MQNPNNGQFFVLFRPVWYPGIMTVQEVYERH